MEEQTGSAGSQAGAEGGTGAAGGGDPSRRGDRRDDDRRSRDRRRTDRRTPVPAWRKPWALVAYGVVGALALMWIGKLAFSDDARPPDGRLVSGHSAPIAEAKPVAAPTGAVESAYGTGDYERLIILGQAAVGKKVRAELFCGAPARVSVRRDIPVEAPIAPLVDAEGHVAGSECRWGRAGDERRDDFVLIVPPALAARFAAAPVTTDDFVQRRHLFAELVWVGRSQALDLRTGGVLNAVLPAPVR
ncbi:MAG: hypothetical protein JWM27_855 [Gemmatimonadetes bacterium]|nr:hypothetical protein [Gemmatimonadota bacterium]